MIHQTPFCTQAVDASSAAEPGVCNTIFANERKRAFLFAKAIVPQIMHTHTMAHPGIQDEIRICDRPVRDLFGAYHKIQQLRWAEKLYNA